MLFSSTLSTIAILAAATASVAAPVHSNQTVPGGFPDKPVTVSVKAINNPVRSSPPTGPPPSQTVQVPLGQLTTFDKIDVTSLSVVGVSNPSAVKIAKVVCQRYRDQYGTLIGSVPFTSSQPANLSTNSVELATILCYVKY